MAFPDSASSLTPVEQQSRWASAVRVETTTNSATHNAVKAKNLSLFIGTRRLLDDAELKIAEQVHTTDANSAVTGSKNAQTGTCYGLVGINGCGKSTLLRLIAERRLPVPPGWDIFIVSQHLPPTNERSPVDEVMSANAMRVRLMTEQASLEEEVSKLSEAETRRFEEVSNRLVTLQSELSQWEGAENEIISILLALGFKGSQSCDGRDSEPTVEMPMNRLSGGWRMKVELAKALWLKPKLLLLDEPTNHLDFQSLQWMSEQLDQYPNTSVVVSHDVSFLYGVCREILWLKDLKLEYLPRTVISQEDLLRMQRSRTLNFNFPTPDDDIGNHGMSLHGVEFSYGAGGSSSSHTHKIQTGKKVIGFSGSSRAVLLGKNGSGKSTFLDVCAGTLRPTRGSIDATPDLKIGHFSQFTDELDSNSTDTAASFLIRNFREELAGHAGSTKASRLQATLASDKPAPILDAGTKAVNIPEKRLVEIARGVLSSFGFEGDVGVTVPVDCLSGGQKALLKFAALSLTPSHILLLDEPSNHIDAEACEALAKGLSEFKGGIVAVTHDELLIYRLINCNWSASELLICREGTVWRQQHFAADCLKALTKEVRGAEEGVGAKQSDKKTSQAAESSSDAKNSTVASKKEVPPWLQKKARPKRHQAVDVDAQESTNKSAIEDTTEGLKQAGETSESVAASKAPEQKETRAEAAAAKRAARSSAQKTNCVHTVSDEMQKVDVEREAADTSVKKANSAAGVDGRQPVPGASWHIPAVLKHTTRTPVQRPSQQSTWKDELWQLQTLYGTCEVEEGNDGQRILHLTHHCTDPDWDAQNWAPAGLQLEVLIGRFYPEPPVEEPTLRVLGPEGLPEKFTEVLPLLFSESASKAPARTATVYRALQFLDKNMATLWRKLQAAAARKKTQHDSDQRDGCQTLQAKGVTAAAEDTGKSERNALTAPTAAAGAQPAPAGTCSVEDARRLGVEVRLLGLTLEGFASFLPSLLRVQVVCDRCRKPTDIETATGVVRNALPADISAAAGIQASCPTCKGVMALHVAPTSCRGGCQAVAHISGTDCHPVRLLRGDFEARCGECGEVARIRNVGAGYRKQSKCTGCLTKLNLAVEDVALLGRDVEKWRAVAEEEGETINARKQLQEARRMEKGLGIKVGQPLPDKGGCKHYKQSYRWLRFPCCGRAFPCDVCHDEQTDHMHEWATRMLCGLCAHEQPLSKDQCTHCGASQNKSQGGYWEGGDGCRDRTKMAKDDPHKYKGLGKIPPKKK